MYKDLIAKFAQPAVLVIGDLMLDVYLKGASANTAVNVKYLGAKVTLCSVSGPDEDGAKAASLLEAAGINGKILHCPSRETIVKTSVMAGHQLLTRYDCG